MQTNKRSITDFIEDMLTEFYDVFSLETICKLIVIHAHNSNKKHKEVVAFFENELKENYISKTHNNENIENIRKVYLTSDHNKINRLKKYTSISSLLHCIGYTNFIHALLRKYPYPVMVGFPFNVWTPKRIYKYMRLYFDIPNDLRKKYLPTIETIRKKMYYSNLNFASLQSYSVDDIINCYLKSKNHKNFHYLYTKTEHYPVSANDSNAIKRVNRYNATIFYTSICLTDEFDSLKRIYYVSYNADVQRLNFLSVFEHIYLRISSNSPILIFVGNEHAIPLIQDYNTLKHITNVPLIIFKNFDELQMTLTKMKLIDELDNLKLLKDSIDHTNDLKLNSRADTKIYLEDLYFELNDSLDYEPFL